MPKSAPLSLEDAPESGLLEGVSAEALDFLRSHRGKPTGPDGIPYTACFMAGMRTQTSSTGHLPENNLLALLALLGMVASISMIVGIDKWVCFLLRPIRHRKTRLPLAELRQCAAGVLPSAPTTPEVRS